MKYGLYEGFERAAIEGYEALTEIGSSEELAKIFAEVAEERIHVKMVKVKGVLELRCTKPNGVKLIKEVLSKAKAEKLKDAQVKFYVMAAPKYSIEALAANYKGRKMFCRKWLIVSSRTFRKLVGRVILEGKSNWCGNCINVSTATNIL